jgi:hypothetical protein
MLNLLGLGGSGGFSLKNNGGTAQIRNSDDSAFADLHSKQVKVLGPNVANGITLSAPSGMGAGVIYVLPGTDGATGQVLQTNGAGTLAWANVATGADITENLDFDESTTSPATIFAPPADARLKEFRIEVGIPAGGGSPTIQIGTSSTPNLYVDTDEIDLKTGAIYIINVDEELGATPDDIILTISPNGQTFTGSVSISYTPV